MDARPPILKAPPAFVKMDAVCLHLVEKGHPVSVTVDPEHPLSIEALGLNGRSALKLLNHPNRLHPKLR